MLPLRRVGLDIGLTDDELIEIHAEIIEAAHAELRAREVFEIETVASVGKRTLRKYTESDMSQAVISMNGETINLDAPYLTSGDTKLPVIKKDFQINWRNLLASRDFNESVETQHIRNASRQVAEEENKLLFAGEYTGWRAYGIEGLMTATSRNTQASAGAWPANAYTDINAAIGNLESSGFTKGPYVLGCPVATARKLDALITSTTKTYRQSILDNNIVSGIIADDMILASDAGTDGAFVVVPGKDNFSLKVAQDISVFTKELPNMNLLGSVYEVVTPFIKRPTSICEITGIT